MEKPFLWRVLDRLTHRGTNWSGANIADRRPEFDRLALRVCQQGQMVPSLRTVQHDKEGLISSSKCSVGKNFEGV